MDPPVDILLVYSLLNVSHRDHFEGVLRYFAQKPNWRMHVREPGKHFTKADVIGTGGIRYGGFIISLPGTDGAMAALAESTAPTVLVNVNDRRLANREKNLSTVWIDNSDIGHCGARHLLKQGRFQSLGFVMASDRQFYNRERESAFRATLAKRNRTSETFEVPAKDALRKLAAWLVRLPKPTAIMCAEANTALLAHRACLLSNLSIPGQVALLSADDSLAISHMAKPTISCVLPDFANMGYRAAKELDLLIGGKGKRRFHEIVVPVKQVIVRASTRQAISGSDLVKTSLEFIESNVNSPLSTTDVVQATGVSRRLVELRFRQLYGHGIREAIEGARMEKVLGLLRKGNRLQQIAQAMHFTTPNALTRAFKRHFGVSVRQWLNDPNNFHR